MLGIAARLAAKKMGKQAAKEADEIVAPNFSKILKAKEDAKIKKDIAEKVGIGVGTVAAIPTAVQLGNDMAYQVRETPETRERKESERLQKQYEAQDKQEGRGMKKGGKVSSASKRADGIAVRGKTKGKMV
jgi:hypothetical protein